MASNGKLLSHMKALRREIGILREENARLKAACNATSILSLPTELLDTIFAQLSRAQVAACRLVCREFKNVSSPYLIPAVTFSRRMDTLAKLFDVLEHKYFSQHVTELVWDASWWDESLTTDFEAYHYKATAAVRNYRYSALGEEAMTWNALWSRLSPYSSIEKPNEDMPDFGELENGDEWEVAFRDAYHLGFHQYTRFWLAQKAMDDRQVPQDVMLACLDGFPKLRSLVYTDFRCLSKPQDRDFDRFCERILDNAATPHNLTEEEVDDGVVYQDLWMILAQLAKKPNVLKSFSIGTNPFGLPLSSKGWCMWDTERPQMISHRHMSADKLSANLPELLSAFKSIRQLRLPQTFDFINDESEGHIERTINASIMPRLLTSCSANLVKLIFTAEYLICFHNRNGDASRWRIKEGSEHALEKIFYPVTFEVLRCLDLRGWLLNRAHLQAFLQRHSATLRQLRVLGNLVTDEKPRADYALAAWMGATLELQGVAMANHPGDWRQQPEADGSFPHMQNAHAYFEMNQIRELEDLCLAGRRNLLETAHLPRDRRQMTDRYTSWRNAEGWAE